MPLWRFYGARPSAAAVVPLSVPPPAAAAIYGSVPPPKLANLTVPSRAAR